MSQTTLRRLTAALLLLLLLVPLAPQADAATVKHGASGQTYVWQTGTC